MKPLGAPGLIMPGPAPWGVWAMASDSLPAKDGAAQSRVAATVSRAIKPKITNPFFRMKSS